MVALALPVASLPTALVPEAARGRAATIAYTTPEPVADFYPNRSQ
jgi:hypothetical protein